MQGLKILLCVLSMTLFSSQLLLGQIERPGFSVTSTVGKLQVQLSSVAYPEMFLTTSFDAGGDLIIETTKEAHSVLLYSSEGKLEFVIPIGGNQVTIGKELFIGNDYHLAFNFKNYSLTEESVLATK